jgi:hypothetical protein
VADSTKPIRIRFERLHCIHETGEAGSDDPYVIFSVTDLTDPDPSQFLDPAKFKLPYPTRVQLTDTFSMGEGDTRRQGQGQDGNRRDLKPLWGLDDHAQPIADPDKVLILVALMESDSGPDGTQSVQNIVQASMFGNIVSLKSELSRHELGQTLAKNMYGAIMTGARPQGIAFYDACLGIGEFSLAHRSESGGPTRLERARAGEVVEAIRLGRGHGTIARGVDISQGALYDVYLRLGPG